MEDQNKPVIDVIIPAYRPDDSFQKLIGLLQEQTVKPHHIYVLQTMGEGDELMQPMNSDMTVHSVAKRILIMVLHAIMVPGWQQRGIRQHRIGIIYYL